jgi:hypothetical protein
VCNYDHNVVHGATLVQFWLWSNELGALSFASMDSILCNGDVDNWKLSGASVATCHATINFKQWMLKFSPKTKQCASPLYLNCASY